MQIPLVSDQTHAIANDYGVLIKAEGIALRGLFIIDPEGTVQQVTIWDSCAYGMHNEGLALPRARGAGDVSLSG
jgi:alkyl hydroperoxide reductase subunit AhpC